MGKLRPTLQTDAETTRLGFRAFPRVSFCRAATGFPPGVCNNIAAVGISTVSAAPMPTEPTFRRVTPRTAPAPEGMSSQLTSGQPEKRLVQLPLVIGPKHFIDLPGHPMDNVEAEVFPVMQQSWAQGPANQSVDPSCAKCSQSVEAAHVEEDDFTTRRNVGLILVDDENLRAPVEDWSDS